MSVFGIIVAIGFIEGKRKTLIFKSIIIGTGDRHVRGFLAALYGAARNV